MPDFNDPFYPAARLEGSAPLLQVRLGNYGVDPGAVDKMRAFVALAEFEEQPALVVGISASRNTGVAVLMDPRDAGVWAALENWRALGKLPMRLSYPLTDLEGDVPLHIDSWVDVSRERLLNPTQPATNLDALDRYQTARKLERLLNVHHVEWRPLGSTEVFLDASGIEAAVRTAVDTFGRERFALTLTSAQQGPLGAPAA